MKQILSIHSPGRFLPLLFALVLALAAASGCAPRKGVTATQTIRLSEDADVTYHYLVYQELKNQLAMARQVPGSLSKAEMIDLRSRAVESLDIVMAHEPTAELYRDKAALFWDDEENGRKSREILREGLRLFPGDRLMTMYLANSWLIEGNSIRAASIMDNYLAQKPDDHLARERYGQMMVEAGKYADALDQFKLVPEESYTSETYYYRARAQAKLGQRKQAIASLKQALKLYPDFVEGLAELAYLHELGKEYDLAEKVYTRLLEVDGGPEVRLRLVNINLKLNNVDRALDLAMDGPKTKSFLLDAANVFIAEGFYAQASTVLDVLSGRKPTPAEYWFYKAVIANEGEGDPAKALGFLEKVSSREKHYPQALQFRAQLLNLMGMKKEAMDAVAEGLELFPDMNRFYILKASLLSSQGDRDAARTVLETGMAKLPEDGELMYELAMLLDSMGHRAEGLALMEKLLVKQPDHAQALNYVGYTLAEEGRDLNRALVLVTNAAKQEPDNGYILDSVAWVYYKLGKLDEAWQHISDAVAVTDDDPTIWEHYGDIARTMGRKKDARKGYEKALKLGHAEPDRIKSKLKEI
ncbi:tetratricopeptide repeat protein [Salidesulfovibrio onnuriiensis]|uniref:tetratricopeptide repeat protein n=1 Tax=Salidesulfovibrio onnuriiensis TaxID=2583823 RepID=UPI0011C74C85|nr:tetratricopeptide repeat protein [Salidesulfovibrio onnuriiensis]